MGRGMAQAVIRLAPLDKNYVEQLLTEFDKVSRAVVVATLLAAVAQGLLAGIGYWLAGFDSVFLLTMLTGGAGDDSLCRRHRRLAALQLSGC